MPYDSRGGPFSVGNAALNVKPPQQPPLDAPGISVATVDAYSQDVSLDTPTPGATAYELTRSLDGVTNWGNAVSGLVPADFPYRVSSLTQATRYYYRLQASEGNRTSPYSNTPSAVTLIIPAAPGVGSPIVTETSIAGTITASNGAVSYETRIDGGSPVSGLVVSGLTADTPYSVEHRGLNAAGNPGPWTTPYPVTTAPAGSGSIPAYYVPSVKQFISWDAPRLAHTGIDIDYLMTAYDWENRNLVWSVNSGPASMSIENDGTLHWVPDTDQVTESVTLACSFGGQMTLFKTFDTAVDNSRCFFVATDGDDVTGDGSRDFPYATLQKASSTIGTATTARTIYNRGGEYPVSWPGWETEPDFAALYDKVWDPEQPLLNRNYPGESVKYTTTDSHGFRMSGKHMVTYGMWFSGAVTSNLGGVFVGGQNNVAKRMIATDSNWYWGNNCTGFWYEASALLHQCQGWDNYDRNDPGNNNNSDFLGFAYKTDYGPSYVIDCFGGGVSGVQTRANFKIKHAGLNTPHIHKCVGINTREAFSGFCNKMTVRHSTFVSTAGTAVGMGVTDYTTGGTSYSDEGWLFQYTKFISLGAGGRAWTLSMGLEGLVGPTPPLVLDCDLITVNSSTANILNHGTYSSSGADPNWQVGFSRNRIYTPSPSNAVRVNGSALSITKLTDMGEDNELLASMPDYTFGAAGRTFAITSGVLSETTP